MPSLPNTTFATSGALREGLQASLLALVLAVPALWLLLHYQLPILFLLVLTALFCIAWQFNRTATIVTIFSYLFLLGDIRRISTEITGPVRLDPLLVVVPLFTVFTLVPIFLKLRLADAFSKAVLALTVILTLAIFNPRQGSIIIGLSGAMFFLVPIFWFWIARAYATERIMNLLIFRVVVPMGVFAALLGYYQTYIGFLPWEEAWIQRAIATGYTALDIGSGHIRSFGFSVSSAEYGTLLMLSSVCVIAAVMRGRYVYAVLLPVLLPALLLASQRGVILKLFLGTAAMWAVRTKNVSSWLPRIAIGGVAAIALLIFAGREAGSSAAGSTANRARSHVTSGFAHPLDPRYSTLGGHARVFLAATASGFVYPLGSGLGAVTIGSAKLGGAASGSSEVDVSDTFAAAGFIGGFFYVFTIGVGLFACGRLVLAQPGLLSFALVGILCSMLGAWIPIGLYSIGPLVWFCLGYLAQDRSRVGSKRVTSFRSATPNTEPQYATQ